ncbi:hypothetical protein Y032_0185g1033 [Ancylostoma ceylanicum]|uniref:Uncharacterized protein n=1 Tax=Ancylostoma ceylanicum TaxID=53326 RepID=A0A016SRK1_9BILA|nr:hypothetical protein Y032_0185g1033 [Ancylostoma ceylanicum]
MATALSLTMALSDDDDHDEFNLTKKNSGASFIPLFVSRKSVLLIFSPAVFQRTHCTLQPSGHSFGGQFSLHHRKSGDPLTTKRIFLSGKKIQ